MELTIKIIENYNLLAINYVRTQSYKNHDRFERNQWNSSVDNGTLDQQVRLKIKLLLWTFCTNLYSFSLTFIYKSPGKY